ncbi:hypothetical protein [Oxynema aestuarii]|nr:hypothetical protein [Oxynema aestuarii]
MPKVTISTGSQIATKAGAQVADRGEYRHYRPGGGSNRNRLRLR